MHFDSDVSRDNIKELQFEWLMSNSAVDLNFESITITEMNNPPVAADDAYTVDEDDVLSGYNVLANDTDIDGDPLTAILENGVAHGTLSLQTDGTFTYTPDANFHGTDSFTYKAYDGKADSNISDRHDYRQSCER